MTIATLKKLLAHYKETGQERRAHIIKLRLEEKEKLLKARARPTTARPTTIK